MMEAPDLFDLTPRVGDATGGEVDATGGEVTVGVSISFLRIESI